MELVGADLGHIYLMDINRDYLILKEANIEGHDIELEVIIRASSRAKWQQHEQCRVSRFHVSGQNKKGLAKKASNEHANHTAPARIR